MSVERWPGWLNWDVPTITLLKIRSKSLGSILNKLLDLSPTFVDGFFQEIRRRKGAVGLSAGFDLLDDATPGIICLDQAGNTAHNGQRFAYARHAMGEWLWELCNQERGGNDEAAT